MTDVRLTATNPEDSSVVPVACNAKGELLLEEPTLASDGYVAKTGDNMTGDLTLGDGTDDKITLDATDGTATFAGDIEVGKYATNGTTIFASGAVAVNRSGPGSTCFYALLDGAESATIKADGSAEFASSAGFGGQSLSAGMIDGGVRILDGYIQLRRDVEGAEIVSGFSGGNTGAFKTVSIRSDGTAEFASDVVVGSRNKKWMLVESNGLCHMVEQPTASTADLVAPAAAEYPPLRDVLAELNAIEKALGEVMEKLRMTPPAGWEVWDGSDENS